jgi:hypothetical protein
MLQIKSPANPPMIVIINVTMNHQPKGFQPFVLSKLRKTKNPITPPQIIPTKTYIKGFFEFIILRGHNMVFRGRGGLSAVPLEDVVGLELFN